MKSLKLLPICFFSILAPVFTACNEDDETTTTLSDDEAADEVASIVSTDIHLITGDIPSLADQSITGRIDGRMEACGSSNDSTVVKNYQGPNVSFDFTGMYTWTLVCSGTIPASLDIDIDTESSWLGQFITAEGNSEGDIIVTGFGSASQDFILNGTLTRNQVTVRNRNPENSFNSQGSITLNEILVDKETSRIQSGTVVIEALGTSSRGGSYAYEATVTFNGDGTASITVNGKAYTLTLATGRIQGS